MQRDAVQAAERAGPSTSFAVFRPAACDEASEDATMSSCRLAGRAAVLSVAAVLGAATLAPAGARAGLPPLIPRDQLIPKPPARQALRLSPDGLLLSYVAADAGATSQLWLQDPEGGTPRQLTRAPTPGVGWYAWAESGKLLCYEQKQKTGSRLVAVEVASGKERALIGIEGAGIQSPITRHGVPHAILVSLTLPGAPEADVYRVDLSTGERVLDTKNPGGVSPHRFTADEALVVRAVQRNTRDGGTEVLVRDGQSAPWRSWLTADPTYELEVLGFSGDGRALLLRTDLGADKSRLVARAVADGREQVIDGASDLDVETVLVHPRTGAVQAVSYLADPRRWTVLDRSLEADFRALRRIAPFVGVASRDRADSRWLVWLGDDRTRHYYLWQRAAQRATLVFDELPHLAGVPLPRVKPISFEARDGLRVHGYLTLPLGVRPRGLPLVVWVHGGPYLRDSWGFDGLGQFFVNRGYAFLRVNYRGSRGFGRRFRLASFKQWGGAMQADVEDAVEFVVRSGTVDRRRVAIAGHSYGGYVALAALTLTPDLFRCAAASSTASNLVAFVSRFPKTPGNAWVRTTVGDPEFPEEAEMLRRVSPFFHVDRLSRPLIMARGTEDGALPPGDLDAFLAEIEMRGGSAASIVYEGDGHFFRRENELDYYARVERLFAAHLGGRAEPIPGERMPGSTGVVKVVGRPFEAAGDER
jgi:dipeptidyl aminopeptidase/acylaminoacyl peptidase